MDADAAYEETAISRLFAAKAHSFGYIFHRFHDAVRQAPDSIRPVMTRLCALYGLYTVQENAGNFLQFNHMSAQQMTFVRQQVLDLCRLVRSDAVALVDAFNLPDFLLNSPLGRYDGDVYVNYFNLVKQRNPPQHPPSYFKRVIYPLIHRKPLDDSEPGDDGEDEE
jgi:acyl-CoA oxidase